MLGAKYGVPTEVSGTLMDLGERVAGHIAGEEPPDEEVEMEEEYVEEEPNPVQLMRENVGTRRRR
jgi:hypothetical protein